MTTSTESFENDSKTPAIGSSTFVSDEWDVIRSEGIAPRFVSMLDDTAELRQEFMGGSELLGLWGKKKTLKPQQLLLADALNANYRFTSVLLPRRSAKTTSLFAWALGRCQSREDYLIGYTTLTTGKKARDRFLKDLVPVMERLFPDPATRPFKIRKAAGQERIEFPNGSIFQILKPAGEDFRSDAYDVIILDEAGEADPEMGADILEAALPTQDTRPDPMIIFAGTAAKFRDGNALYDALEDGRAGADKNGILDYSAPDTTTEEELADWEPTEENPAARVRELVELYHPGVGNLTTLEAVKTNFLKMKREQFTREYLGLFGMLGVVSSIVDPVKWAKAAVLDQDAEDVQPPKKFALAAAVHPDQITACLVAVWRDIDGIACVLVLKHRTGTKWLNAEAKKLSLSYKTPLIHDTKGAVTVNVEEMRNMRPSPKFAPQTFGNIPTAAALIIREIEDGRLRHWNQDSLNEAARSAKKRPLGPTAWALGRGKDEDADIIDLEAASLALRYYDEKLNVAKAPMKSVMGV